jgi:hypothetical protein
MAINGVTGVVGKINRTIRIGLNFLYQFIVHADGIFKDEAVSTRKQLDHYDAMQQLKNIVIHELCSTYEEDPNF